MLCTWHMIFGDKNFRVYKRLSMVECEGVPGRSAASNLPFQYHCEGSDRTGEEGELRGYTGGSSGEGTWSGGPHKGVPG